MSSNNQPKPIEIWLDRLGQYLTAQPADVIYVSKLFNCEELFFTRSTKTLRDLLLSGF